MTTIQFDYKVINENHDRISLLEDGYENFGWEICETMDQHRGKQKVKLRRNRHIEHKMELTRLQRHFEANIQELDHMEKSKSTKAIFNVVVLSVFGLGFLMIALMQILYYQEPNFIAMSYFAIPGFACFGIAAISYPFIKRKESARMNHLINQKYDEIYGLFEKGKHILSDN